MSDSKFWGGAMLEGHQCTDTGKLQKDEDIYDQLWSVLINWVIS